MYWVMINVGQILEVAGSGDTTPCRMTGRDCGKSLRSSYTGLTPRPVAAKWRARPHGGVRPFHQKLTCLTQSTLGPDVVKMWSRNTPESGVNETLVQGYLAH